jgi:hypothetical protein
MARFVPQGQGIAFTVLGGVFAEGVDLPGSAIMSTQRHQRVGHLSASSHQRVRNPVTGHGLGAS